jgi:DNA-binding transcriptional regulator GbsR (MarR family)
MVHTSMNHMGKQLKKDPMQKLCLSVGNFIRYWGFRRIHGAVWAQLYLSKTPLSCSDLTRMLGHSKALISPALLELSQYELIREVPGPNDKTKLFAPTENINEIINNVLKKREAKMLEQINKDYAALESSQNQHPEIDEVRLESMGEMILSANMMLELILSQKNLPKMRMEFDA